MEKKEQVSDYYVQKITLYFMENETAKSRNFLHEHLNIPRPQVNLVIEGGLADGMIIADKGGVLRRTKKFMKQTGVTIPGLNEVAVQFGKKAVPRLKGKGVVTNMDVMKEFSEEINELAMETFKGPFKEDVFQLLLKGTLAYARPSKDWKEIEEHVQETIRELKSIDDSKKKYKRVKKSR